MIKWQLIKWWGCFGLWWVYWPQQQWWANNWVAPAYQCQFHTLSSLSNVSIKVFTYPFYWWFELILCKHVKRMRKVIIWPGGNHPFWILPFFFSSLFSSVYLHLLLIKMQSLLQLGQLIHIIIIIISTQKYISKKKLKSVMLNIINMGSVVLGRTLAKNWWKKKIKYLCVSSLEYAMLVIASFSWRDDNRQSEEEWGKGIAKPDRNKSL